ncbi:MAG: hypothetical protein K2H45_11895 [Acetatifactor sp.]|nr:hypothetical protein [Acetatifactor sp.]
MRKKTLAALLVGAAIMLAGCGNTIPDMTDEQLQAVGEYAAQLLLSHDVNYRSRLVDVETLVTGALDELPPENLPQESLPQETPEPENVGMDPVEETPVVDLTEGRVEPVQNNIKLEEALGLPEQMILSYTGYEILDQYPNEASSEEYFTVDAEEGNRLIVLHFSLLNQGEGTETANIINRKLLIDVSVNGISTHSLSTLLENDLTLYREDLNPGESKEVVILAEYETESLRDVASVEINVKNDDKNATIRLE